MYGGIKGVETMEIRILGTGGFSNDGSFYNCFTIDKHLLVETPPDILQSLHACSIQIEEIETILISHFHGDHCFGLPFLLFNMFIKRGSSLPSQSRLRLIAPPGVRDWMKNFSVWLFLLIIPISNGYFRRSKLLRLRKTGAMSYRRGFGWNSALPTTTL